MLRSPLTRPIARAFAVLTIVAGILGVPAGPAEAASTCTKTGSALAVVLGAGDVTTISAAATTGVFSLSVGEPPVAVPCTGASNTNIDSIAVTGSTGAETLRLDLINGDFAPGVNTPPESGAEGVGDIEITVDLGTGTDTVSVIGTEDVDNVSMGTTGINLNNDADADVTLTNVERVSMIGVGGADTLRADGFPGTGTGAAATIPVTLDGGAGIDTLNGGAGADSLRGGPGSTDADTLNGGAGIDTADFTDAATTGVTVNLATNTVIGGSGADQMSSIENVLGSTLGDVITGDDLAPGNLLDGAAGDDTLNGGGGTDTLIGGLGNNTLNGGAGDDALTGGVGDDSLVGGDGADTVDYSAATTGVTVDLAFTGAGQNTGTSTGTDTISQIENILGSAFNDTLKGSDVGNIITGGKGNDTIQPRNGDDIVTGGEETDPAVIDTDIVDYSTSTAAITCNLSVVIAQDTGAGSDTITEFEGCTGGTGADTITGDSGANTLSGGAGNDVLIGAAGNDALAGGDGADTANFSALTTAVTVDLALTAAQSTGDGSDTFEGVENVTGGTGNDVLAGDANANTLTGGAGNDRLTGGEGDDALTGGDGDDTADYSAAAVAITVDLANAAAQDTGAGNDTLATVENVIGGSGNDTLKGDAIANVLTGGPGDDAIDGLEGLDTAGYGTAASGVAVSLAVATPQNTGGAGTDTFTAIENLVGSPFNDTLTGSDAANVLSGSGGDDLLKGGAGDDTLAGGDGIDTADYFGGTTGVTVNLSLATAQNTVGAGTDTITGVENVRGTVAADTLTGNAEVNSFTPLTGNDTIKGGAGNDVVNYAATTAALSVNLGSDTSTGTGTDSVVSIESVIGGSGSDTLVGDGGANTLIGGAGNDKITGGSGDDTLLGGAGNDTINGGSGADSMNGGSGTDTASFKGSVAGVVVNLAAGTARGGAGTDVSVVLFENVIGSSFGDRLTGADGANTLDGGTGSDILSGGAGNDRLLGGAGNDTLSGGSGIDLADFSRAPRAVVVTTASASGDGTDRLGTIENLTGSVFADRLTGNSAANVIRGGSGNDIIDGNAGNDTLYGDAGNDSIDGDLGIDRCFGGSGTNRLTRCP